MTKQASPAPAADSRDPREADHVVLAAYAVSFALLVLAALVYGPL